MKKLELAIGPSNGWIYASKTYDVKEHNKILKTVRARAVELALVFPEEARIQALRQEEVFTMWLEYVSLHLPDYNPNQPVEAQVALASEMVGLHGAAVALMHPSSRVKAVDGVPLEQQIAESRAPNSFYVAMKQAGVPLAIENMDKDKLSGYNIDELYMNCGLHDLAFVLDVQHAFEHDHDMGYAKELLDLMEDRLVHLHVSGATAKDVQDRNHQLVHKSDNREAIVRFTHGLLQRKNVPIILEGRYADKKELKEEIKFLERELA